MTVLTEMTEGGGAGELGAESSGLGVLGLKINVFLVLVLASQPPAS